MQVASMVAVGHIEGKKISIKEPLAGRYKALDMYAGCGGMSLGLRDAGFSVIHANEINKDAAATYAYNFPETPLMITDVRKIDTSSLKKDLGDPLVDVIAAGPPCQGFSIAGRRRPDDPRNMLFLDVLRFVREFSPKIVVIENVVGMLAMRNGKIVSRILEALKEQGYYPCLRILQASDYGVPQKRRRVFIIASSKPIPEQELFPPPSGGNVTVGDAISDLAFLGVNARAEDYVCGPQSPYQMLMRSRGSMLHNHESPNHSDRIQKRFESVPIGKNGRKTTRRSYTSKRTYCKLHPTMISWTLTTLPEDFIHYSNNRIPTVREMARLQSFPDHFRFLGPRTTGGKYRLQTCPQYTQVGNAVPPRMAAAVFKNLARVVCKYY